MDNSIGSVNNTTFLHCSLLSGQNCRELTISYPFLKQALFFTCLQYKPFENTEGKGEIARNEQFLPFPSVFSIHLKNFRPISSNLKLSSANSFNSEESTTCRLGKGYLVRIYTSKEVSPKSLESFYKILVHKILNQDLSCPNNKEV